MKVDSSNSWNGLIRIIKEKNRINKFLEKVQIVAFIKKMSISKKFLEIVNLVSIDD